MRDVQRGLAQALVLVEALTCGQRDQCLAKHVLVATEHGMRAAPAGGFPANSSCCRASAVSDDFSAMENPFPGGIVVEPQMHWR